ncbi:MAG: CotH kinase family protein [Verrucomicrobiota bacterium]
MNERLAFRLYDLAGLPSPDTAHLQFRVIDEADEKGPDQYSGDLWGLYMGFEAVDGFLLDNCEEPDSELHRISQSGNSVQRPPLVPSPPEKSFGRFWRDLRRNQSAAWWEEHVDLERYFSFHTISIATARIDQKLNHNHFLYRHPDRGWHPIPWDTDLCLRPILHSPNQHRWHPYLKYCLAHDQHWRNYQNRARALLDLLFNRDQMTALVDELSQHLGPVDGPNFGELDRLLWNHHPRTTRRHAGTYLLDTVRGIQFAEDIQFDEPGFAGRLRYFKDYLSPPKAPPRGRNLLPSHHGWGHWQVWQNTRDPAIPVTPTLKAVGPPDARTFQCSPFSDPDGDSTFAGMQWRIGEVYNPSIPGYVKGTPYRYEIETVWESPLSTTFTPDLVVPTAPLAPGHTYRLRVRTLDRTGRWSHWSAPATFTAPALSPEPYQKNLIVTEIMYHPATDSGAEFIELLNNGTSALDLSPLRFTSGIDFTFRADQPALAPGRRIVLTGNLEKFRQTYPQAPAPVGPWKGKLDNGGETIRLKLGDLTLLEIEHGDKGDWPLAADGQGPSLQLKTTDRNATKPEHWQASPVSGGTPGK